MYRLKMDISSTEVMDYLVDNGLISTTTYRYIMRSSKEKYRTKFIFQMCLQLADSVLITQKHKEN